MVSVWKTSCALRAPTELRGVCANTNYAASTEEVLCASLGDLCQSSGWARNAKSQATQSDTQNSLGNAFRVDGKSLERCINMEPHVLTNTIRANRIAESPSHRKQRKPSRRSSNVSFSFWDDDPINIPKRPIPEIPSFFIRGL